MYYKVKKLTMNAIEHVSVTIISIFHGLPGGEFQSTFEYYSLRSV